eukprot:scaffold39667_cov112-Isochrysis_galbana.AAC.3
MPHLGTDRSHIARTVRAGFCSRSRILVKQYEDVAKVETNRTDRNLGFIGAGVLIVRRLLLNLYAGESSPRLASQCDASSTTPSSMMNHQSACMR